MRQFAERVAPVGGARDPANALRQTDGADAQIVRCQRFGLLDDPEAQLGRILDERLGNLVELNLLTEPALRRPMAALGAARRLVREDAAALKLIRGDVIRHRLQRAGVEGARDAVRAVRAAVEQRLHAHRRDRAVTFHAGLDAHQHRMAPAVAVEHLFARQADLHRAIEHQRGLRDDDFVVERIALAAEAAAVRRRDDADVRRRHRERLRERAVDVVRRLRARPQRQLAIGIERGHGRVLLDRQMRVALVEERVVEHVVGRGECRVDVAELERHELVDVPRVAVLVDARLGVREAVVRARERAQRLVLDVDQVERLERRQLVARDHRGDRIADEADAIDGERMLVLAHRQDAVCDWKIASGQREEDAGMGERARHVEPDDARVRERRAQQLAVDRPRQHQVVGELRLARHFRAAVHAPPRFADDVHRASRCVPAIAASTASKIC